jgi:hypothetical protein
MIIIQNATCKDCGAPLKERKKSKRPGELLLICTGEKPHKWQARMIEGHLHLYRSNWKGQRGEGRKVAAITISPWQQTILDARGVKQQHAFNLGIDILRDRQ